MELALNQEFSTPLHHPVAKVLLLAGLYEYRECLEKNKPDFSEDQEWMNFFKKKIDDFNPYSWDKKLFVVEELINYVNGLTSHISENCNMTLDEEELNTLYEQVMLYHQRVKEEQPVFVKRISRK